MKRIEEIEKMEAKQEMMLNESTRRNESEMKVRIPIVTIVIAAMLSCGAPHVFAEANGSVEATTKVMLAESQTDFNVPLMIEYESIRLVANTLPADLDSAPNEQITSGDIGNNTVPISSSEVPLAGGNTKPTTQGDGASALNMATLIMALSCLAAFAFLGFLFIKRRKEEKKLKAESR
ncbi:MAG: hypothetical protein LBO70_08015 [Clostridiales Family XIII bacterium]|jgi:hypothetical protein|nr:hypothetical protein [Clostridiales Family XIII bacterium]